MVFIDVWVAYETVDDYGRRGCLLGVHRFKHLADEAAKGKGWWGGHGAVVRKRAILNEQRVYLLEGEGEAYTFGDETIKQSLKEAALAKLSPEERAVLGLE